ncbi:macro domain-containing protein [Megasphaera sp.]|uniref:macro domain-containing protein n=1 Tax=Megasphaera sp. TaxID=2023260 RepID=UPI0025E35443|nr:macro domain-containing protein [uncultured Megasphaera sp.]
MQFRVLLGDLSDWKADGIVYSASSTLLPTNSVSTKIHQKGGLSFSASCRKIGMCHVGSAVMTKGYKLKASFVIHAVGPYWVGGKRGEEGELLAAYKKAIHLADEKQLKHMAFASLCTEEKRYPLQRAASAAVPLLLTEGAVFDRIDLVCTSAAEQEAYTKAAVFFWLRRLSDAAGSEQAGLLEDAGAALALMQSRDDAPDPIALSEEVKKIEAIIHPFLKLRKRSLVDIEQAAAKIMALYPSVSEEGV